MGQKKTIKICIIALAVLLGLSLLALGGIWVYTRLAHSTPATVTVPDNLITPDEDVAPSADETNTSSGSIQPAPGAAAAARQATTIALYSAQPEENTPFRAGNLFPGDSETKYFRVQVSYHSPVTVQYTAVVRPGYEKLAEVLKVQVRLLTTGETMYDGLMRDMPESLSHRLVSQKATTDELYYAVTAYLDTSVGNAYQNKKLVADFRWWVEETGNLDDSPKTGETVTVLLWVSLAAAAGLVLLLLTARKRKEEQNDD